MNRLTSWIKTVIVGYGRHLTAEQLAGDACVLCGHAFSRPEDKASFGWIGLLFRRRAYACRFACTLDTVDGLEELFRSAIPARQNVWLWHLGLDDVPLITAPDDHDIIDDEYAAQIDSQPKARVEVVRRGGTLTTRPLPLEYAERIAVQAMRLGFTAMIDEDQQASRFPPELEVVTPHGPGIVIGANAKVVKVTLDDGQTRNYPITFVKPRSEFGR